MSEILIPADRINTYSSFLSPRDDQIVDELDYIYDNNLIIHKNDQPLENQFEDMSDV